MIPEKLERLGRRLDRDAEDREIRLGRTIWPALPSRVRLTVASVRSYILAAVATPGKDQGKGARDRSGSAARIRGAAPAPSVDEEGDTSSTNSADDSGTFLGLSRKTLGFIATTLIPIIALIGSGIGFAIKNWPKGKDSKPPFTFANADLETKTNARYGFSFQYPVGWVRKDPDNSDGYTFVDPNNPLVVIRAYGSLMVPPNSLEEEVQEREQYIEKDGGRVLMSMYSGSEVYHVAQSGKLSREDAEGWFLRYREPAEPRERSSPDVTVISRGVLVQRHHFVTIEAQAPSKEFDRYDKSFQRLTALLRVYDKCNDC